MIHAVKIQFTLVRVRAKSGIGKVHVAIAAHHYIVGRVEPFALETRGQYIHFAFFVGARQAALAGLAGIQSAIAIKRIAHHSSAGFFRHLIVARTRCKFAQLIHRRITEQQIAIVGPRRAFGETQPLHHTFHFKMIEVLRVDRENRQQ